MMRITKTISLALVITVATSLLTAIPAAAAGVLRTSILIHCQVK